MQKRHLDYKLYFNELAEGTRDIVIPYIESVKKIQADSVVLEVGCGRGGNLFPFLEEKNCKVIGIDKSEELEHARELFKDCKNGNNLTLLKCNFYEVNPNSIPKANIVLIRDVLEHIVNRDLFFERLKEFIANDAIIFVAFPPWRMPFGGHQQGCKNFLLSKMPYYHLLPRFIFELILKIFGEDKDYIDSLHYEVRQTKLSICGYKKLLKKSGFKIKKETYYLINPSYKTKFGLNPRVLPGFLKIPALCDFYTTAHYSIIS
jgi:SAM-dependent methyltransferase